MESSAIRIAHIAHPPVGGTTRKWDAAENDPGITGLNSA